MGPWAQCTSEPPVRFVVPPLELLGCGCLEGGVDDTHGDHAVALRGVILVASSRRFVRLILFTDRQLLLVKHWRNQPRFGVVLMVDLPPLAERCWRAVHDHGVNNSKESLRRPIRRAPSWFGREHRRATPVSQQCRASW